MKYSIYKEIQTIEGRVLRTKMRSIDKSSYDLLKEAYGEETYNIFTKDYHLTMASGSYELPNQPWTKGAKVYCYLYKWYNEIDSQTLATVNNMCNTNIQP